MRENFPYWSDALQLSKTLLKCQDLFISFFFYLFDASLQESALQFVKKVKGWIKLG